MFENSIWMDRGREGRERHESREGHHGRERHEDRERHEGRDGHDGCERRHFHFAGRGDSGHGPRGGFGHGFGGRGHGGPRDRFERGFGRSRERMFDAGDVKLVVLKLLSEQPSYGYQLIKVMEERLSGGYTPSAGVIYPTLTMLEEEGLTTATMENGRRVYSVTAEGLEYLKTNGRRVEELFERLGAAGRSFERGRSPEIMKAFGNLRGAVVAKVSRESVTPEEIRKITEAIDAAAKAIDKL